MRARTHLCVCMRVCAHACVHAHVCVCVCVCVCEVKILFTHGALCKHRVFFFLSSHRINTECFFSIKSSEKRGRIGRKRKRRRKEGERVRERVSY